MFFDRNYRTISYIPIDLLCPIIETCGQAKWTDGSYDRFDKPLTDGKLVEFPFIIVRKDRTYTALQTQILMSCVPLLNWITCLPGFTEHKWIRGEVATILPGTEFAWHKDSRWFHEHCHRLHIPIVTNDDCFQLWDNEQIHMNVGYLYEINNRVRHTARNFGNELRTHLILDLMPEQKWLEGQSQNIDPVSVTI